MKLKSVVLAGFLLSCAVPVAAQDAGEDPRLEFMKSLAGTWETSGGEMDGHQGIFEYRVTAGGHTVEERLMVGSPMEMLTLYTMDDGELVARHYCVMGNQPRLLASAPFDGRSLSFTCDGHVANAETHDDAHIHHWTMMMSEGGELSFSAEMVAEGRVVERPAFSLKRVD